MTDPLQTTTRAISATGYGFTPPDIDWITSEIHKILTQRDYLTMGTHGELLATEFAAYCGAAHAVALQSGTAALEIILRALNVQGGEVIVPTNTFGASVVAIMRAGAKPVFADTADDMSMSIDDVSNRMTRRTRAVLAVHIGGLVSPRIAQLVDLCAAADVPLVEDAAHATGAMHDGRHAGTFGVAAAFSFFSTKVLTSGEGGMLVTSSSAIRDRALLLRDHAKNRDGTMSTTGYNWRLTEFQAIVARAQLRDLERLIAERSALVRCYEAVLRESSTVRLLDLPAADRPNGYKFVVFSENIEPETVRARLLHDYAIALGGYVYRVPCHRQDAFAEFANGTYPGADRYCATHFCPPTHPAMSEDDGERAARALLAVLQGGR